MPRNVNPSTYDQQLVPQLVRRAEIDAWLLDLMVEEEIHRTTRQQRREASS